MRNQQATQLLFELSKSGRRATRFPQCDVPNVPLDELLPSPQLADRPPPLPELAEPDVVRHYTNLSTLNMSVDTHFYPLGSCTMKHNPKRNERLASLPGFLGVHPLPVGPLHSGPPRIALQLAADVGRDLGAARRVAATGRRSAWRIDGIDGRQGVF